ncbi:MAG: secretin N-terminal domain-containing protein, partial [Blastocatellia bacterium]
MRTKTIKLLFVLLICLTGSALAQQSGQQNSQPTNQASNQQVTKPEPQYVDFNGFKGKVLEVKNRDPRSLVSLLTPLGSGFKGAVLSANSEFKTITIRDFPENIATIEEALKRMDVQMPAKAAEPSRPDVEIYGYVLIASQGDAAGSDYPKAIEDVIKQ